MAVEKIYGALQKIQQGMGNIPKNGKVAFGQTKYEYVTTDDILAKYNELAAQNNVLMIPFDGHYDWDFVVTQQLEGRANGFGSVFFTTKYRFISTEDGSSIEVGPIVGQGAGSDDKALRKAATQTLKIALLQVFAIVTGEPDPAEAPTTPVSAPPAEPKAVASASKARAASKAPAKSAPAKPTEDVNALRTELIKLYGSQEAAVKAGGSKFGDKDWANDAESLKALIADKAS